MLSIVKRQNKVKDILYREEFLLAKEIKAPTTCIIHPAICCSNEHILKIRKPFCLTETFNNNKKSNLLTKSFTFQPSNYNAEITQPARKLQTD